jgi:hypothetical protein
LKRETPVGFALSIFLLLPKSYSPQIVYAPWVPSGASAPREEEPVFVSGFGAVSAENRSGFLRPGAWIQVRFTAFKDPRAWNDARVPIAERLDPARVVWHEIPVGLLPAMHVGQVWKAGKLQYPQPGYEYQEFRVLIKNTGSETVWRTGDTCRIVSGSQFVKGDPSFLLVPVHALRVEPPGRAGLRWPVVRKNRELSGVYCLRIVLPGSDDTLVIPCTEVARFYYANSSNLANALFAGFQRSEGEEPPRHLDEVYNLAESHVSLDGIHHIQMRMRYEREDAQVAARLRYDDDARRRALAVGASLQRAEATSKVPLVQAEIPFEGETTLGVHGTWMEQAIGGKRSRIFFVFWIEKCTGPWPFSRLTRDRDSADTKTAPVDDVDGDGGESPVPRPGTPRPTAPKGESIVPELPSMLTGLRKVVLRPPSYEPDDGPLYVEDRPTTLSGRPSGWGSAHPEPPTDGVSPQPGTYGKSRTARGSLIHDDVNPGFDSEVEEPRRLQLGVETFRAAVTRMAAEQGWFVTWLKPTGDGTDPDPVFPVRDLMKKRPAWSYIERGEAGERGKRRHVLIAEVRAGANFVYLLEAERRQNDTLATLLLAPGAGQSLGDHVFRALLQRAVERGARGAGIWETDNVPGVVLDAKLVHPHRLTDGASGANQEEYTADFAQHLLHRVQKALSSIAELGSDAEG